MIVPRAARRAKLNEEILALRKGLWEKVNSRVHSPRKIFPYGPNSDEVMLHGTVKYGLKAGGESGLDWAAYAHLTKLDGAVKMDFYQVYLVSMRLQFGPFKVLNCCRTPELRVNRQREGALKDVVTVLGATISARTVK